VAPDGVSARPVDRTGSHRQRRRTRWCGRDQWVGCGPGGTTRFGPSAAGAGPPAV